MKTARIVFACALLAGVAASAHYYWPRTLQISSPGIRQVIGTSNEGSLVYFPGRALVGELAEFDDGLFAYLMFDHYRGRAVLEGKDVLLTSTEQGGKPLYHLMVALPPDLIRGVTELADLKLQRLTSAMAYRWVTQPVLSDYQHQTTLFLEAYQGTASRELNSMHGRELQGYLQRFIRFKSMTDPRIQSAIETVPSPLTKEQASLLAADMIAVARFYDIPLPLLVGIGAMENNYMNVPGDLVNTAWKRRPQAGDVIVRRTRHGVLVWNSSVGVWQITRESLRYAHRLYRKDKRDYSALPERLRPSKKLDLDEDINPDVLTTYAGLLLRDLLDRFHGDVTKAAGAYNGTVKNPNLHYAEGVEMIADYARRVIERAAALNVTAVSDASLDTTALHARVPPLPETSTVQ